ncbi:MAG: dTDP-4-dehydrorhamnose reductase [Nitrospinota bacterium]
MKVVVTGARGMLGGEVIDILTPIVTCIGVERDDFDITEKDQTIKGVAELNPDIVVHTAAYTNVDNCEGNKELAYRVNGEGTRNIAMACSRIDARMIYISTDYLFDGTKGTAYHEDDQPNPINIYGDSKLRGEREIQEILSDYLIIRTSWLFGPKGKNFVDTILRITRDKKELKIVNDQVGSPTLTIDLAKAISRLIDLKARGVINVANSGSCSWYDFADKIIELSGINGVILTPVSSRQSDRPARRPYYSVLDCSRLRELTGHLMRKWEEALAEYLGARSNQSIQIS